MPIVLDIDKVEKFQYELQLITTQDILDFVRIANQIDVPVLLTGVTEDKVDWRISAKSILGTLALFQVAPKFEETFHSLDYNNIYCLCEKDIYQQIQKYVKP